MHGMKAGLAPTGRRIREVQIVRLSLNESSVILGARGQICHTKPVAPRPHVVPSRGKEEANVELLALSSSAPGCRTAAGKNPRL
uniref:Uncharacterized protein n=1 Tax=Pyricularia oryzae (strain P131) TaxID=1143193 RepID=L7IUG2_PYRO1